MSHPEQLGFFRAVRTANAGLLTSGRVLEVGSYDVNGNVRGILAAREHVGVDLVEGPSVDKVMRGHEVDDADGSFDACVSGECFEHDPDYRKTFANMVRLTRPGGLVAFSCASRGRPEHGTARSDATLSPGTQSVGLDYYRNLTARDFGDLPLTEWFSEWRFWFVPTNFDLLFVGIRRGDAADGVPRANFPAEVAISDLAALMPRAHRIARMPLRFLARSPVSEERYQALILPYWRTLLRVFGERATRSPVTAGDA